MSLDKNSGSNILLVVSFVFIISGAVLAFVIAHKLTMDDFGGFFSQTAPKVAVLIFLIITIVALFNTWDGVFNKQNGEFFHGHQKIGFQGFLTGFWLGVLLHLTTDGLGFLGMGLVFLLSTAFGLWLSNSAKAHFVKVKLSKLLD
jgi:hypothetical protein